MQDFISMFMEYNSEFESPGSFWKWSGYALVSAVLRNSVYHNTGNDILYPNIYVLLLADSAAFRKGGSFPLVTELLTELHHTKIYDGRASIQALLEKLSIDMAGKKGSPIRGGSALLLAEELASFFVADPQLIPMITNIYRSRKIYTYDLRGNAFTVKDLCVSMLSASNEIHLRDVYDSRAVYGGLLGRTFLVKPDERRAPNSLLEVDASKYNTKDLLPRFLETLHKDLVPDTWTLSIADNGSTDGSVEWLESNKQNYSIDRILYNKNIGYAGAINQLASMTDNEILCAVNADTWFTTKHVLDMINCFQEHPNIAIAGPKQLDEHRRIRHAGISWQGDKTNRPSHRGWAVHDPEDKLFKDLARCWTISGSIYYIRRSVWEKMYQHPDYQALYPLANGAFLPTNHYFEETFCSQWAQKLGYEVWYNGLAETTGHTWGGSLNPNEASRKYFNTSKSMYIEICNKLGITHEC